MFFLFILIIILILIIAIHTSKIGIEVVNLIIDTQNKKKINDECKIYAFVLIFNKIKLFKRDLRKGDFKLQTKKLDIKLFKNRDIKFDYKELIKKSRFEIGNIDLNIEIGTEDAALTAISVGAISSVLGFLIRKPKFEVVPVYMNKNLLKLELDGIFTVYLMHYIYSQTFKKVT